MADGQGAVLAREIHDPQPVPLAPEVGHLAEGGVGEHQAAVQVVPPPGQGPRGRFHPVPIGGQRVLDRVDEPLEAWVAEDVGAQGLGQRPAGGLLDDRPEQDVVRARIVRLSARGNLGLGQLPEHLDRCGGPLGRVVAVVFVQAGDAAAHPQHLPDRGPVRVEEPQLGWEMVRGLIIEAQHALLG